MQINNLLTSKDTREVTVVVKGVAITKYPIYRELQVFDFDRSGKTASLAEGLINESETLKPFFSVLMCLTVWASNEMAFN